MKIDKIESFFIRNGYVIRIHTDTGISGVGQLPAGATQKPLIKSSTRLRNTLLDRTRYGLSITGNIFIAWVPFVERR